MKLSTSELYISKVRGSIEQYKTNIFDGTWRTTANVDEQTVASMVYHIFKNKITTEADKITAYNFIAKKYGYKEIEEEIAAKAISNEEVETAIRKLMNFFTEFEFEPNFRFVNTFAYACNESTDAARKYIECYFELTDSISTSAIKEKIKSIEFTEIINAFKKLVPTHVVNTRFKLYYGSAGTGKTSDAMAETNGNCMVCHSAMLPSDLMEDFKFNDGKAEFIPSALQNAMTEGKPIVLDEINLLPFESLRFLQTILDGKKEFQYKGKNVEIKDGFTIIGTMNLVVNGNVYSLPEPLVDRCKEIRKYRLTAANLIGAII